MERLRIAKFEPGLLYKEWRKDLWNKYKKFWSLESQEIESIMGEVFVTKFNPNLGWDTNLCHLRRNFTQSLALEITRRGMQKRSFRKTVQVENIKVFPCTKWNAFENLVYSDLKKEIKSKLKGRALRTWMICQGIEDGELHLTKKAGEHRKMTAMQLAHNFGYTESTWWTALNEVKKVVKEVCRE